VNELNERWATMQRWWLGLERKEGSVEMRKRTKDGSEQKLWGTQGLLKLKERRWAKIVRNERGLGLACLELARRAQTISWHTPQGTGSAHLTNRERGANSGLG